MVLALAAYLLAAPPVALAIHPLPAPQSDVPSQSVDIAPPADPLAGTSGIDGTESLLAKARYDKSRHSYFAPLAHGGEAQLTLDHALQTKFDEILKQSRLEAGAIVAMDPRNGRLLGLAEMSRDGKKGTALNAAYPAASVFKIVTAPKS